jgi:hypothetical protein
MNKARTLFVLVFGFMIAGCGGGGSGEVNAPPAQSAEASHMDIGDHTVHFSALATDQLSAEIAKAYDIVRSKNRAMLNVSVLGREDGKSVPANVVVKTANLTGQAKTVTMRRIDEGDAIYYIGITPVANRETLIFEINVTPEGSTTSHDVRFQRQFYTDN